jgi:hypothetical protein
MLALTTALDLQNAIGFRKFYGTSPAIDFFAYRSDYSSHRDVAVLIYDSVDLRHILRTLAERKVSDVSPTSLTVYMADESPANILRHMIIIKIITDPELTDREKVEVFLDFYWNVYITAKTLSFVEKIIYQLSNEIPMDKVEFFSLSLLKYKDKDTLVETIDEWRKFLKNNSLLQRINAEEKFTRNRQTALYKERWEHRKNLVDADFIWGIKDNKIEITKKLDEQSEENKIQTPPCIHFYEYLSFRENLVAFQLHDTLENHKFINFSMLDYQQGKKKIDKTSCGVLGYWGDITTGPFPSIGFYINDPINSSKYYKKQNDAFLHTSSQIAEFNVSLFIKGFIDSAKDELFTLKIHPILRDEKKDPVSMKTLSGKMDIVYLSSDIYQKFGKNISETFPLFKEKGVRMLIAETVKFCAAIDLKKRDILKEMMTKYMEEIPIAKLLKDADHHLVYEIL